LVTTSPELAEDVSQAVAQWLLSWPTADVAGQAWEARGEIVLCDSPEETVTVADRYAPEHLEVQTSDPDWYLDRLTNYGSLFLGELATVALADKAIGTNHVLPTAGAARYTGGLWVGKFLKTVTYQRVLPEGMRLVGPSAAAICDAESMLGHALTVRLRLDRLSRAAEVS
jgi:sulfopropanediol 3-dehydrogenase